MMSPPTNVTSTYAVPPTKATSIAPPTPNTCVGRPSAKVVTAPVRRSTRSTLPALGSVTYRARSGPIVLPDARPLPNSASVVTSGARPPDEACEARGATDAAANTGHGDDHEPGDHRGRGALGPTVAVHRSSRSFAIFRRRRRSSRRSALDGVGRDELVDGTMDSPVGRPAPAGPGGSSSSPSGRTLRKVGGAVMTRPGHSVERFGGSDPAARWSDVTIRRRRRPVPCRVVDDVELAIAAAAAGAEVVRARFGRR